MNQLREWEKHILDDMHERYPIEKFSLCGVDVSFEFTFQDVDHAFRTRQQKQRLFPCPACRDIVIETLRNRANI